MKKHIITLWNAFKAWPTDHKLAAVFFIAFLITNQGVLYLAGLAILMYYQLDRIWAKVKDYPFNVNVSAKFDNALSLMEKERFEWSLKTFPEGNMLGALEKCREELMEIEVLLKHGTVDAEELATEYADALMVLMDSAQRAGLSVPDIFDAYKKKMAINKARTWKKNPDNSYSHIKDTEIIDNGDNGIRIRKDDWQDLEADVHQPKGGAQ